MPALEPLLDQVDAARATLSHASATNDVDRLLAAAGELEAVDRLLRGPAGVVALLASSDFQGCDHLMASASAINEALIRLEAELDDEAEAWALDELERANGALTRLKDVAWALGRDRPAAVHDIVDLARGTPRSLESTAAYWAIHVALSALDRLEVRGRDSAGLHLLITAPDDSAFALTPALERRSRDALFTSGAVRDAGSALSFVYKVAREIGELGDNTRRLRAAIRSDDDLHRVLRQPAVNVVALGHTRWASVGIISESNAHPLNSDEAESGNGDRGSGAARAPYVTAAINGDIDNYRGIIATAGLDLAPEITTDSKVLPVLVSRNLNAGRDVDDAVLAAVSAFEGSAAAAVSVADRPDRLHLGLHGSGQSLYVGLAEDCFIVASELYGIVQEARQYVAMEGEGGREGRSGQMIGLDQAGAGTLSGITRINYDGTPRPLDEGDLRVAEITTRDIDRAGFQHFLLKEVTDSPGSFSKTLRGRIVGSDLLSVRLGADSIPPRLIEQLRAQGLKRIITAAQGTAAVAGEAIAAAIGDALKTTSIRVDAMLATELSGFHLEDDMSDVLVIAVSQSGTTTDTNRTVDLVRSRGAIVVSIVNRRGSDLVDKSDGVLFTSDGRDIEMSVASTKAFYAQIAAGFLIALALADITGCADPRRTDRLLRALRSLPDAMQVVLARRQLIADIAAEFAPSRRHWAVVGNGMNRIAAEEVRIKLSELCYHSIACDSTEDKKHIDLSSEPLALVCAAGLEGPTADDVAKEVAILRAHKAAPIVVATEGQASLYPGAVRTIEVPAVHPEIAFVLSVMAGHLFGYGAAMAIDDSARPLREAHAITEAAIARGLASPSGTLAELQQQLAGPVQAFTDILVGGGYDGNLNPSTASRLSALLDYATRGMQGVDAFAAAHDADEAPADLLSRLEQSLSEAVGELTRPIDAIKHQAKTVTVGISRAEGTLVDVPLIARVLATGAAADDFAYHVLRVLGDLDAAVDEVLGFTRYRIEGDLDVGATIEVKLRGGSSEGVLSRTEADKRLMGVKRRAALERTVKVAVGARDGRELILVPEGRGNQVDGLTLLHVRFRDRLDPSEMARVLTGYNNRYAELVDAVTETSTTFEIDCLSDIPVLDLLTKPVDALAREWAYGSGRGRVTRR